MMRKTQWAPKTRSLPIYQRYALILIALLNPPFCAISPIGIRLIALRPRYPIVTPVKLQHPKTDKDIPPRTGLQYTAAYSLRSWADLVALISRTRPNPHVKKYASKSPTSAVSPRTGAILGYRTRRLLAPGHLRILVRRRRAFSKIRKVFRLKGIFCNKTREGVHMWRALTFIRIPALLIDPSVGVLAFFIFTDTSPVLTAS